MAGSDYVMEIPGGGTVYKPIPGDFIFAKAVERPVEIIIDGQTVKMEAGDNYRPGERFGSFEVYNPEATPVVVRLVVGKGQYTRQIVQGQIKAEWVLRGADGQTRPDTRHTVDLTLVPADTAQKTISEGQSLGTYTQDDAKFLTLGREGYPLLLEDDLDGTHLDPKTLTEVGGFIGITRAEPGSQTPSAVTYVNGLGLTFLDGNDLYLAGEGFSGEPEHLGQYPGKTDLAYDWSRHEIGLIDHADQSFIILDASNFAAVRQGSAGMGEASDTLAYDPAFERYTVAIGQTLNPVDPQTFEVGFASSTVNESGQPHIQVNRELYNIVTPEDIFEDSYLEKRAAAEITTPFTYRPQWPGQKLRDALIEGLPGRKVTAQTIQDASITSVEQGPGYGSVLVTGEIIRAVLEIATGRAIADGYLDHVFAIDAPEKYPGERGVVIDSGTESFARTGVVDDGNIYLPRRISVTYDAGLTFKPRIV